jgi:site-specific recombinase XerD
MNQHKDRFLFQCATGCRFSDMFEISRSNIIDGCIEYFPKKTHRKLDNKVIVPLNDLSKVILEKYDYNMKKLIISNQKYNDGLADMVNELRKDHPALFKQAYTTHNGRDSFITIAINSDVDVPSLLKMVGQNSWAVMQRYYKIDRNRIIAKMKNIKVFDLKTKKTRKKAKN